MHYDKDLIAKNFQKMTMTFYNHLWPKVTLYFSDLVTINDIFFRLFSLQLISCFFFHYVRLVTNFGFRFLRHGTSHHHKISQFVSIHRVAVRKEIFRSKVKGQGHNGRSKFKVWQSITLSIINIETCNLHQNVQNHILYDKKIISCHAILVNYCVILHNMKNWNFKQSYLTHFSRYDFEIFTDVR